ncbi:YhbY family RNA-binding protein [Candidatus Pacearchaeota archaeon]|nr:YhbY family RNA-binding protein [Candidatus Pacearchaeota archaeon]
MVKERSEILQLQIGKNGLTDGVIAQIKRVFENEKIMKISILKSACRDKAEAKQMCDKILGALGKNFTYRLIGYVATFIKFRRNVQA